MREELIKRIQAVSSDTFEEVALSVFQYQYKYNDVYRSYSELMGINISSVAKLEQIPFLPISFFKSFPIRTGSWKAQHVFRSSTTTGAQPSVHYIHSLDWYEESCRKCFVEAWHNEPNQFAWLGLLPSYMERNDASLLYMVDFFRKQSHYVHESGFYLSATDTLDQLIQRNQSHNVPTILIGVTFALLAWAKQRRDRSYRDLIIIETGGMKGRGRELVRAELHDILQRSFSPHILTSEYGMTELMSQAYLKEGRFQCPLSMRVLPRMITDPLHPEWPGRSAVLNIIDLHNIDTCAFIGTDDIGIVHKDGSFEVLGRLDNAEQRGCNLMISEL